MMLFRPNFCANCGEKIERIDWHLWSSRRFCELCATEFQVQEYAPRIIIGVALLAIVSSAATYFGGTNRNETTLAKRVSPQRVTTQPNSSSANAANPVANINTANVDVPPQPQSPKALAALPQNKLPLADKTAVTAEVYFCGAETKKGTACSRRVKGNSRCFQHVGMPSMLTADKLKIPQ